MVADETAGAPDGAPARTVATFDAIMAAPDLGEHWVEIPEWGSSVKVRGLSRGEWAAMREASKKEGSDDMDAAIVDAQLLHLGMVEPQVSFEQAVELLNRKGLRACGRLTEAILAASGIGDGFREAADAGAAG